MDTVIASPAALPRPYYSDDLVTLYQGEAIDILTRLRGLGAIITDPPYSSGGLYRGDRSAATSVKYVYTGVKEHRPEFSGDSRDQRSFALWASLWLGAAQRAALPGAPVCCFSDWRQLPTITDAIQCGGWTWRGIAIWSKGFGRPYPGRFSNSAEYIAWGSNGAMPQRKTYPPGIYGHPSPTGKAKKHIAQKPLPVMRWLCSIVAPDATLCDPFAGSGSTLIAARSLGLRAIGIEIDTHSCDMIAEALTAAAAADKTTPAG
jgi:site-specific DNA-methyltransferase (adenine-specific)